MTPAALVNVSPIPGTPIACGSVVFRHRGQLWVTAIAKASFDLVPGGVALPAAPAELVLEDRYVNDERTASLRAASDLVPHRPRVDVTFVGHAYAPGAPTPTLAVRLTMFRERTLIDKTIHVYGDRSAPSRERASPPRPFERIPLIYERAYASPFDASIAVNPVGTTRPNLVDPGDPKRPAGFGPISRDWPNRTRFASSAEIRALDAAIPEIADAFDWRYFQVAPPDQQIDALRGDEWIGLDGVHPTVARLQTRLPSVAAVGRVYHRAASGFDRGAPLALVPDTVVIDGDRRSCDIVFRGRVVVPGGEAGLSSLRILIGLDLPTRRLQWPDVEIGTELRPTSQTAAHTLKVTLLDLRPPAEAARMMVSPFPLAVPSASPSAPSQIPGAPWSASAVPSAPEKPLAGASSLVDEPGATPAAARRAPSPPDAARRPPIRTLLDVQSRAEMAQKAVAPFALAAPGPRLVPSPEIAGAPWAGPAAPVPKIQNALSRTSLLVDVPRTARGVAAPTEVPASSPVGAGALVAEPEAPRTRVKPPKRSIYGKPKQARW